jgi:hypothetical protein
MRNTTGKWQALGVCFTTTEDLVSSVLETDLIATLNFQLNQFPVWRKDEWEAADRLYPKSENVENSFFVLRQFGETLLYRVKRVGDLRIHPEEMSGYSHNSGNYLPLEMESLEIGVGLILSGQGVPVFHAAGVEIDGEAVALVAYSGSGKSSLATTLVKRGCGFLADDIVAAHGNSYKVWPGHLQMRLHPDSAVALLEPEHYSPIYPENTNSKCFTRVHRWGRIQKEPCPLKAIYLVDSGPANQVVHIASITGYRGLQTLVHNQIRYDDLGHKARLALFAEMLRHVSVRKISYPHDYTLLDQVADQLIADVQNLPSSG